MMRIIGPGRMCLAFAGDPRFDARRRVCGSPRGRRDRPRFRLVHPLPRSVAFWPSDPQQELLDRLLKMEQRLDRGDEAERGALTGGPGAQGGESGPEPAVPCGTRCDEVQRNAGRRHHRWLAARSGGGGSETGGGDPTTRGEPKRLGIPASASCGSRPTTTGQRRVRLLDRGRRVTLDIRALSQLDARIYEQQNQSPVSSGFHNPRTRIYFEGQLTRPILRSRSKTRSTASAARRLHQFQLRPAVPAPDRPLQDAVHLRVLPHPRLAPALPRTVALRQQLRGQSVLRPDGLGLDVR